MGNINLKAKDKKIITLVGMMGTGKTMIGYKLAKKLEIYCIDSDREIEDDQHKSVADIFACNGEEYFRKLENKIIKEIISRDESMVLSLGGGAFINSQVRKLVKEKTVSVWLDCDIQAILKRTAGRNRPLLKEGNKKAVLADLIIQRAPIYQQADLMVNTSASNSEIIVNNIIKQIRNFINN